LQPYPYEVWQMLGTRFPMENQKKSNARG